jgi:ABC-2 type transport system permease protein
MHKPSALASRYRYSLILLKQMVATDFKLRYQGSVLGYLWSLLKPLALFSILYLVFVRFLKIGASIPDFPVYLLLGIVVWSYFVEVTNQSIRAIVDRDELIRKINFPRYVIVLSSAVSSLINLLLNLVVVGAFMVLTRANISWTGIVWAPVLIVQLFVVSLATAFFLSALYVRFRDLVYIWEVFLQAAFYATPILYPLSDVPVEYAKWLSLSPLAQVIQDLRYILITPQTLTLSHLFHQGWIRLIPVGLSVLLAVVAVVYFRRRSRYFAEDV